MGFTVLMASDATPARAGRIVKMRQAMQPGATASTRGILRPHEGRRHFRLTRELPAPDLATWVERLWMVEWDLREPYTQELLNHPTINMAVEATSAGIFGIRTERDQRTISGTGRVVGVKFRPGAFQPFYGGSVHQLTNRVLPLTAVFGPAGDELADAVRAEADAPFAVMEDFLRARLPEPDPQLDVLADIVGTMLEDPAVVRVDELAARHAMSPRSLQRLFRRYVGVSPKWVLRRYRLHEAAERIAEGRDGDWAATALELGYFDQAHFIRDFKALIGASPAQYAGAAA
jgi:AraC-like DNA-binding protein